MAGKYTGPPCMCAPQVVYGAPECMSYVFNADGKCTSYTGGYVVDRRVGNTQVCTGCASW